MNRLADASGPDGSAVRWPGTRSPGCIAHLPGLLGLTTPSTELVPPPPAALLELGLHRVGHREPRGRGPRPEPATGTTRRRSANLELKASDASANPYISLGGVMAAALDGIERGLDPGEPVDEDPGNLTDDERASARHPPLPGDSGARRSTSSRRTRS